MPTSRVTCCSDFLHYLPVITIYNEKFVFSVCKEDGGSLLKLIGSRSVGLLVYSFMYAVVTSVKNAVYITKCNCCRNNVSSNLTEFNEYSNPLCMLKT